MIALASEYSLLTPEQRSKVTWIICDDGTWTQEQIDKYIEDHFGVVELTVHPEDWTKT